VDAKVRVYVTDSNGSAIPNAKITLASRSERLVRGTPTDNFAVPFGRYTVRVSAPGFHEVERDIRVYQTDVWMHIGLQLGNFGDRPYRTVEGSVTPAPDHKPCWIRLLPVFGTYIAEAQVDSSGHFALSEVDLGKHILLVIAADAVIHSQQVTVVPGGNKMIIRTR
jgi:hypothetical protein